MTGWILLLDRAIKIFFVLFIFDTKTSNKLLGKKGVSLGTLSIHSISNFFSFTHTIEV